MDLLPNAEQQQIIDSVREFFAAEFPLERLQSRNRRTDDGGSRWQAIGELGFFGLGLPEAKGGSGYSLAEEMLLFREAGRFLAPPSLLAQVIGARIAVHAGLDARGLISGDERAAWMAPIGSVHIDATVTGEFHAFDDTNADWLVACNEDRAALISTSSVKQRKPLDSIDASISLARVSLDAVGVAMVVPYARENIMARIGLNIAAQLVGVAEASRDMAVDYAKVRKQFDQPIGAFQAIKHKCVDMAIRCESAWCQVVHAALARAADEADAAQLAAAAMLLSLSAANENAAANVQVHGAIGYTAECKAHHFVKRARVLERLAGNIRNHQRAVLGGAAA